MAVVTLAEELNYARASEKLNITELEMRQQITELEKQLELRIFRESGEDVEVTKAGQVLVEAFRTLLATAPGKELKARIRTEGLTVMQHENRAPQDCPHLFRRSKADKNRWKQSAPALEPLAE